MPLAPIEHGAGIVVGIENLKLNSLKSRKIEFSLDKNNSIKELDENNNIAKINF
jgi:subtilase family serine protease